MSDPLREHNDAAPGKPAAPRQRKRAAVATPDAGSTSAAPLTLWQELRRRNAV